MFKDILIRMVRDDLFVVVLLVMWSVIALAVILERVYALWDIQRRTEAFKNRILSVIRRGELAAAAALCEASTNPIAQIFAKGLEANHSTPEAVNNVMTLKRAEVVQGFKSHLWLLGTIGASAPFVGLFGTVIGVVRAFHSMGQTGQGGFRVVASGISEALGATALGLLVAIYAVIAYNYFVARVNRLGLAYKVMSEEIILDLQRLNTSGPVRESSGGATGKATTTPLAEVATKEA